MKKSKLIKVMIIISMLLLVVTFSNCVVYAVGSDVWDPTINPGKWEPTIDDTSAITTKAGTILGVINVIGVVSSVIVLAILGLKYIMGSIEEKAEYKKAMIPYLIGMFLLVSATTIPNILYQLVYTENLFG